MFIPQHVILVLTGTAIASKFPDSFCVGAEVAGIVLFVFAWIGRGMATRESP